MEYTFYKKPWFLLLVAFAIWGCGYITADDVRIDRENQFGCTWSKTPGTEKPVKVTVRED